MKARIIKKLKSEKSPLSKDRCLNDLGISLASFNECIRELRENGYTILQTDEGIRLTNEPDVLFPWEFNERESSIHHFPETGSTMDIARQMAKDGCPHFTVVIAESQTKGRGRLKRTWISKKGGLYFTLILRPDVPVSMAHIFNFAASLSLARVIHHHFSLNARVKWPNDILIEGKKISGLLSEMETDEDRVAFVNIGMGINVNNDPTREEPNATSMKLLSGKEILRKRLLSLFLDEFENTLNHFDANNIMRQWKEHTMTIGKEVRVVTSRDTTEGTAMDVDDSGALIVKLKDGTLKHVIYGDCFVT